MGTRHRAGLVPITRAMQYSRDWFAKMMLFGATDIGCDVHLQEPVTPEVLAIDAWIEPRPKELAALAERGAVGRMCAEPSVVEVFHPDASMEEVDWSMLRVTLLHQALRERAGRGEGASRRTMPERPHLWVICTERAQRLIDGWGLAPMADWPAGFFGSPLSRAPGVVLCAALPRTRETLVLRAMGSGAVRDEAIAEALALPEGEWERVMIERLLRVVRTEFLQQGARLPTEDGEMTMDYKAVFAEGARLLEEDRRQREQARIEGRNEGRDEGRNEGRNEGRREGVAPLVRLFERRLSRALTEAEQRVLLARLDTVGPARLGDVVLDLDPAALAAWLDDPDAR